MKKEIETTTRMNKKLVTFEHPFLLDELETELPPGDYTIETEEESIDGLSFLAFRRIATTLIVRPPVGKRGPTRFWPIDPQGLEAALEQDAERTLKAEPHAGKQTEIEPLHTSKSKSEPPHG